MTDIATCCYRNRISTSEKVSLPANLQIACNNCKMFYSFALFNLVIFKFVF